MSYPARSVGAVPVRIVLRFLFAALLIGVATVDVPLQAQSGSGSSQQTLVPGRNVNMVSGTKWPDGDPYLQRQNEPSVAASTRNPLHLLAGSNDYRTVDIPFVSGAEETGDAWLGLYKSFDAGQRWKSTLLPGYPQDRSSEGMASPIHGYQAGADPVVRAGTNGLFFYAGLVFDRADNGRSAVFVARFIDDNNREDKYKAGRFDSTGKYVVNLDHQVGDPIRYLNTNVVAASSGTAFLDKPWIAVDVPRVPGQVCRIDDDQQFPAGNVYVAFSSITEDAQGLKSEILLSRSTDCGATWSGPVRVSNPSDRINLGASIAIDSRDGSVYVAWRRFAATGTNQTDGFMVAKSITAGRNFSAPGMARAFSSGKGRKVGLDPSRYFEHRRSKRTTANPEVSVAGEVSEFDQPTEGIEGAQMFRTNAYPTMAIDGNGRVYLAWSERGVASSQSTDARILISTSQNGRSWTTPQAIADEGQLGHQIMPSLVFGGGRLVLVYYDLRETYAGQYTLQIDDRSAIAAARRRHTLDLRASVGLPGAKPVFGSSIAVSDYLSGYRRGPNGTLVEQRLQYNPPNLPMFKQGTAPFMGDYVDVTVAPAFVPTSRGGWAFNTAGAQPVFHAVWTDNRDVRQPSADLDGDGNPWNDYTPPTYRTGGSVFDPDNEVVPPCDARNTGSRNQNIYTARLSTGLITGSPGNTKPLDPVIQRAFVVFAQNTTNATRSYRFDITNQPPGGYATFDQFDASKRSIIVTTPAYSSASRSVYATSTDPSAQIKVTVTEVPYNGTISPVPLSDVVVLNPDIANPDIANPDIANPDIANPDIKNAEVYNPDIANPDIANPDIANPDIANPDIANPDIANPDIANPDIANPDIANPDIANPDIANVDIANPDIANPDIANPDIANPDIANPDIANPDIANPDIANSSLTDVTWTMVNNGNTTAAFNVNLFLAQQTSKLCEPGQDPNASGCIATQLVLRKVYNTPNTDGCELKVESRNVLIANIPNPTFVSPGSALPDQNDPSLTNATLWLAPGESAKITLRVYDPYKFDNISADDDEPETSTDPDDYVIDPIFLPTTQTSLGSVTPVIQQQAVDTADVIKNAGAPEPPAPPLVTPLTSSVPEEDTPTAVSLLFVTQPSDVAAGSPMAPFTVEVRDQYGVLLPGALVRLFLASNPGSAALTGFDAVTGDGTTLPLGVATFSALTVSLPGTGYSLAATSGTALPAVSSAFNVAGAPCDPLVVTTTADTGTCGSLRWALQQATSGQTITFEVVEPGPHVFAPLNPLPAVGSGVIVDATTDSHYALGGGQPVIQISGANMPAGSIGLALTGTGSTVRGIEFNGFVPNASYTSGAALLLAGGGSHTVQASHFGMIASNYTGVEVQSSANLIGGHLPGQGNVIGGNGQSQGVWVRSGAGNRIEGNFIGNNGIAVVGLGLAAWSNDAGVTIDGGATATVIGLAPAGAPPAAPGAGNVISGNNVGVLLRGGTGTEIRGNRIGLNAAGTGAIPNNQGVSAYNLVQNTIIHGNFVSGNSGWGIALQSTGAGAPTGTQILQNTIGLDTSGAALGNVGGGVLHVNAGGTTIGAPGSGNVISGNGGHAVLVQGTGAGVIVKSNRIGTDPAGTAARPNGPVGGDLAAVMIASGVSGVQIGGDTTAGEGNVISGNSAYGVKIWGTGNSVFGNLIGTNAAGTAALPNVKFGIHVEVGPNNVIGGAAPGQRNVISGNLAAGIALTGQGAYAGATNTQITGNYIGLNAAGTGTIPNGGAGVDVREGASGILAGNTISANAGPGVVVWQGATGTTVSANAIYVNGGLGIDYEPLGAANGAPVLSNIQPTQADFAFTSPVAGPYIFELFSNVACDPSGSGEGQTFIGSFSGGTSGTAFFSAAPGSFITMSATDSRGTTEFSNCLQVPAGATPVSVSITGTGAVYDGSPKPANVITTPSVAYSVTYDGTLTVPSAIGAYAVVATVTQPGYVGSASATHTIASTLPAGGQGGGPYGGYCAAGVFANGFIVNQGTDALGSAGLLCSDGNHPSQFGGVTNPGWGPPTYSTACPAGEVMVGFYGTYGRPAWASTGDFVTSIAPRCQALAGGPIAPAPLGPQPAAWNGTAFSYDCPAGEAVTGVVGGAGSIVDSMALVCSPVPASGGTITSVTPQPAGKAFAQAVTVVGSGLPFSDLLPGTYPPAIAQQVVITQGGVEYPAVEVHLATASKWIFMLPQALLPGAATITLRNAEETTTTNPFSITVSDTPSAPVIQHIFQATSATGFTTTPVASLIPGAWLTVEADGVSTSAYLATYVFTPASGAGNAKTSTGWAANVGGVAGGIRHTVQIPADLDVSGWVDVQVYLFGPSLLSNAVRFTP